MASTNAITLRGVRVHNLKNLDVTIPLHRLTVVTGVSGAGKSSLVFDTLYAEAQRRYLQSFSVYTRQFLERFDKPDAEFISDLPPAVAIRPAQLATSSRMTVGALTEVDTYLRLLFARVGVIVCPSCGQPVQAHKPGDVLAALNALPAGTRCSIAFPIESGDDDSWQAGLREEGYVRIQVGGVAHRLDEKTPPAIAPGMSVWVILDRIEIGKTSAERLAESIDAAFQRGDGRLGVLTETAEMVFARQPYCARCQRAFPVPEPALFDASAPLGACPDCDGLGTRGKNGDVCATCAGRRLNPDALAVQIDGKNIADWNALPLVGLLEQVTTVSGADATTVMLRRRLQALIALGVDYSTLQQPAASLSAGAALRVRLAAAAASDLVNVLYLVEEPTIGLHARELSAVREVLLQLRDRGNTVVVIENERNIMAAADHLIDLGPGAGEEGGNITYQGAPDGLAAAAEHPTSDFWTGRSFVEVPEKRRKPSGWLKLADVSANNLKELDVAFPLGTLCVVCGVAGAGKSSLVEQALYPALAVAKKKKDGFNIAAQKAISGAERINDVVLLDQAPLARGARSNAATYLKIFDEIRDLFAQTADAKIRNYGPGHFSFNQPGGRCEACEGQGTQTIDMQFLADVQTICPECQGRRYRKEILAIKVRSLSIAEVLELTVREAFRFFRAQPAIEKKLKVLLDVGLEYLRLGQSVEMLSGSECQRLKLAAHLASSRKTGCLFLLLDPTAGLHPSDVVNLVDCCERLLAAGHSLVVVDNDLDVIKSADWVIELGPEGGEGGGRITAAGTPEQIAEIKESSTGQLLHELLIH